MAKKTTVNYLTMADAATIPECYKLHLTLSHTGKMKMLQSLSTACICNTNCQKYASVNGSICQHCFAHNMFKRYGTGFKNTFVNNYNVLTTEIIPAEYLPIIFNLYFRFEAFGDLQNDIQFINYLNICRKNPRVNFALWTKNPHIIKKVFNAGYKKPKNLNILVSSLFINKSIDINKYDFVDKVFTVYDKKYIKQNDITINCGAKSCAKCLLCYTKNNVQYINEKLK